VHLLIAICSDNRNTWENFFCYSHRACSDNQYIIPEMHFVIQENSTNPDAGYPDRLGPSGEHFLTVIVLHLCTA